MIDSILIAITVALGIAANIFWYSAKSFILRNGLKSDMFWLHFRDFRQLRILMSDQYSKETNAKARFYIYAIPLTAIISAIIFLISFLLLAGVHAHG